MNSIKIKKDRYRAKRGGNTKLLDIACSKCSTKLFVYQKDGQGGLFRCYLDRIVESNLIELSEPVDNLYCYNCKNLIGVHMIYAKEKRPAYRLIHGNSTKLVHH